MKAERSSRTVVYQSPWVNLYLDRVKFSNGHVIEQFHMLDFEHPAVAAIVEDELRNILFVRVYRYTTDVTSWEIPAGGIEAEETVIEAARREVLEETGYESEHHQLVYSYYPMNGSANKLFHIVFCKAAGKNREFDTNEVSEIRWFPKSEIEQLINDRQIVDGFSLTALLLWLRAGVS